MMGYSKTLHNWQFLMEIIKEERLVLPGLRMAELGNQYIWKDVFKTPAHLVAKDVFESFGVNYYSFDLNGLDGALPLDLSVPLPEIYLGGYDIVTNCGTSEHVHNQYECWANIHRLCRVLGIMWHFVPEVGSWAEHNAVVRYTADNLAALADACGYEAIRLRRTELITEGRPYHSLEAAFLKLTPDFITPEQFAEIMPCSA